MSFEFTNTTITLICAPFGSVFLAWLISRQRKDAQQRSFCLLAAGIVGVLLACAVGVSLWSYESDLMVLDMAYLGFGTFAVSAFRLRPLPFGGCVGVCLSIPLLIGSYLGPAIAYGVDVIVGDMVYTGIPTEGVKCYVTSFGDATTSTEGFDVAIHRQLPILSFLEIADRTERYTDPDFSAAEACARAYVVQPR